MNYIEFNNLKRSMIKQYLYLLCIDTALFHFKLKTTILKSYKLCFTVKLIEIFQ